MDLDARVGRLNRQAAEWAQIAADLEEINAEFAAEVAEWDNEEDA